MVQKASDWEESIRLLNGVRQGLVAALFTEDRGKIEAFYRLAEAGILKVNQSTADAVPDVAFGGWKSSGIGPPEHGDFDLEFYTKIQTRYSV